MKADQERVYNLLKDTIILLCKNGLTFQSEVSIEGLLGVRVDQKDVFFLHISETSSKIIAPNVTDADSTINPETSNTDQFNNSVKDSYHNKKMKYSHDIKVKTEKDCDMDDIVIKTEKTDDYDCSIVMDSKDEIKNKYTPSFNFNEKPKQNTSHPPKFSSFSQNTEDKSYINIGSKFTKPHKSHNTLQTNTTLTDNDKYSLSMNTSGNFSNDSPNLPAKHWSSFNNDSLDFDQISQNELSNSSMNFADSSNNQTSSNAFDDASFDLSEMDRSHPSIYNSKTSLYNCKYPNCGRSFTISGNLWRHEVTHHGKKKKRSWKIHSRQSMFSLLHGDMNDYT